MEASTAERFWSKVDKLGPVPEQRPDLGPCWIWTACLVGGYGQFALSGGRRVRSHRFAYEALVGPIPEGLTLDHLCDVSRCVNPRHLVPATAGENALRGHGPAAVNARKDRCKRGHPIRGAGADLYIKPDGARRCRPCDAARARERRALR